MLKFQLQPPFLLNNVPVAQKVIFVNNINKVLNPQYQAKLTEYAQLRIFNADSEELMRYYIPDFITNVVLPELASIVYKTNDRTMCYFCGVYDLYLAQCEAKAINEPFCIIGYINNLFEKCK